MYNIYSILGQNQHWLINKTITRMVGIHAALLLSDLVSKRQYFIQNGDIKSVDDWFFNTVENIELDTTLSPHDQRKALKILLDNAMVKTKQKGVPKRRFYMINDRYLAEILTGNPQLTPLMHDFNDKWLKSLTTSGAKFEPLYNKIKPIISNNEIKLHSDELNSPVDDSGNNLTPVVKQKDDYGFSSDVINTTRTIVKMFPKTSWPNTTPMQKKWLDCVDKCQRIDKYDYDEIINICNWARNHHFWKTNFYTVLKLRKTKDGVKYIHRFAEQMKAETTPKQPKNTLTNENGVQIDPGVL